MEPQEDLAHICFKDVSWLQAFPLQEDNILDYFSLSQFYDRTCNNEVLKMQSRFTDNAALSKQLHSMTGIEYACVEAHPPKLFIIAKQQRNSSDKVQVLQFYYILDGSIYMAPSLGSIVNCRLSSAFHYLMEAFRYGKQHISFDVIRNNYIIDADLKGDDNENILTSEDHILLDKVINDVIG